MRLTYLLGRMQIESERFFSGDFFKKEVFPGYIKIAEKQGFDIYRGHESKPIIVAAHNSTVVTKRIHGQRETFVIYPSYTNRWIHYKIDFNEYNFPGLIKESRIANCLIIPYLREVEDNKFFKRWRVVIFTDKGQIFHNFPSRGTHYEGYEQFDDIKHFEESVIWDIPNRKYPSMNQKCDETEYYFPALNKECYEYHPTVNKQSKYGNEGFDKFTHVDYNGKKVKVARFYIPVRCAQSNPFAYMGGVEMDYKMTLIGTYQSNKAVGVRTGIFATSDGGRSWYSKYEFADEGVYEFKQGIDTWGLNFGNPIDGSALSELCGGIWIKRKILIHSEEIDRIGWDSCIDVEKIIATNPIRIKTCKPHNLSNGNIVAICCDKEIIDKDMGFLFNNDIGDNNAGNGILYKVKVIDNDIIEIYENVSNPFSAVACRHVHHINRVRDGWIVGTGEIFPNGWLFYIQMKAADTYTPISAANEFPIFKLNSKMSSVQRTLGADIIDGEDPQLVFASDHDLLNKPALQFENNVCFSRNSTGIYAGRLKDVDDISKFRPIFEAKEPAYFFKKLDGKYVFSGQRGEVAISDLTGKLWETVQLDQPMIHYKGKTYRFHVIDKYLIILK